MHAAQPSRQPHHSPLPRMESQNEALDRDVGNIREVGGEAGAAGYRDSPDQVEVDLAAQGEDEVWQRLAGSSHQIHTAAQWVAQERRDGDGGADAGRLAVVGAELLW